MEYGDCDDKVEWESFTKNLKKFVNTAFKNEINVRDRHIHQFRYTNKDMERLSSLEHYKKFNFIFKDLRPVDYLYNDAFKKTRKFWHKLISSEIVELIKVFDIYCEMLLEVLTDDGNLIYPSDLKD